MFKAWFSRGAKGEKSRKVQCSVQIFSFHFVYLNSNFLRRELSI